MLIQNHFKLLVKARDGCCPMIKHKRFARPLFLMTDFQQQLCTEIISPLSILCESSLWLELSIKDRRYVVKLCENSAVGLLSSML